VGLPEHRDSLAHEGVRVAFTPAMRHPVQMVDVLWGIASLAVLAGMAWLGYKIEPHWVSKDGERFLCVAQVLDHTGDPLTRWKECRVAIDGDWLRVDQKRRFRRPLTTYWKLEAEGSNPPRRKIVFVGRRRTDDGIDEIISFRMPAKSRAAPRLRQLLPNAA
jgi:hypothetical protein